MRKSILIGVLAALMLFAFTACEQNMPSTPLYGAQVESITVAEQPVYIVRRRQKPPRSALEALAAQGFRGGFIHSRRVAAPPPSLPPGPGQLGRQSFSTAFGPPHSRRAFCHAPRGMRGPGR